MNPQLLHKQFQKAFQISENMRKKLGRHFNQILSIKKIVFKREIVTCLVVQWLRLCTPNAGSAGSAPGWRTKTHAG